MKNRFVMLIIAAALLFGLLPSAFAEDPINENATATLEAQPTDPAPPTGTPAGSTDSFVVLSVWQIVAGIAAAFSVGGLTIGTGMGVFAYRLRHNPTAMAAIEGLAASTPDSTVQVVNSLMDKFQANLTEAFALAREAFDRIPAANKTPEEREAVTRPGGVAAVIPPTKEGGAPSVNAAVFPSGG